MAEEKSLMKALNDSVRLPGETMKDFADQLKGLTEKDRADLIADFEANGQPISKK